MTKKQMGRKKTTSDRSDWLRSFINEQWESFAELVDEHQWPLETARWYELVFCLLLRMGQPEVKADRVRNATQILANLDLLKIEDLAGMLKDDGKVDTTGPNAVLILSVLKRTGLTPTHAELALVTICEAASALHRRHGGKIQRYLRFYGEQMLNDIESQFSFSQIGREDIRLAFTHWLQNVLNMPLELWDVEVRQFCREFQVSREELIGVVDELDINLALLDDVLSSYIIPLNFIEDEKDKKS